MFTGRHQRKKRTCDHDPASLPADRRRRPRARPDAHGIPDRRGVPGDAVARRRRGAREAHGAIASFRSGDPRRDAALAQRLRGAAPAAPQSVGAGHHADGAWRRRRPHRRSRAGRRRLPVEAVQSARAGRACARRAAPVLAARHRHACAPGQRRAAAARPGDVRSHALRSIGAPHRHRAAPARSVDARRRTGAVARVADRACARAPAHALRSQHRHARQQPAAQARPRRERPARDPQHPRRRLRADRQQRGARGPA